MQHRRCDYESKVRCKKGDLHYTKHSIIILETRLICARYCWFLAEERVTNQPNQSHRYSHRPRRYACYCSMWLPYLVCANAASCCSSCRTQAGRLQ